MFALQDWTRWLGTSAYGPSLGCYRVVHEQLNSARREAHGVRRTRIRWVFPGQEELGVGDLKTGCFRWLTGPPLEASSERALVEVDRGNRIANGEHGCNRLSHDPMLPEWEEGHWRALYRCPTRSVAV